MARKVQMVFDCRNPADLSKFYADALQYKLQEPPEGYKSWKEALKAWGVPEEEWKLR
jgi:Glyoxalase-like domain